MFQRPGQPSDPIPGPFPNDEAARAAEGGALPPDLSMIVKARDGGPDYVYRDPERVQAGAGRVHGAAGEILQEYFPGHLIAMPPPLSDGAVTYADGTKATVKQMAHDVAGFPQPGRRSRTSIPVIAPGSRCCCF